MEGRLTEAVRSTARKSCRSARRCAATSGVAPAGKVKGVASITVRFNRLTARDENYQILSDFSLTAPSSKKKDAAKIGIGGGGAARSSARFAAAKGRGDRRGASAAAQAPAT